MRIFKELICSESISDDEEKPFCWCCIIRVTFVMSCGELFLNRYNRRYKVDIEDGSEVDEMEEYSDEQNRIPLYHIVMVEN